MALCISIYRFEGQIMFVLELAQCSLQCSSRSLGQLRSTHTKIAGNPRNASVPRKHHEGLRIRSGKYIGCLGTVVEVIRKCCESGAILCHHRRLRRRNHFTSKRSEQIREGEQNKFDSQSPNSIWKRLSFVGTIRRRDKSLCSRAEFLSAQRLTVL